MCGSVPGMDDIDELLARLPRLRELLGWNQTALAKRVGVTQPTICDWENGRKYPSRRNERTLRAVLAAAMTGEKVAA